MVPKIAIVIPHYSGGGMLRRCLRSLRKTVYRDFEIVVVDNGSQDRSVNEAVEVFPEIRIVRSPVNLGFAGGCNLGIRSSKSPFVILFNDDAEADPGWLGPMVRAMEADSRIAAVQPKVRSMRNRRFFDYSGAAGGEMDLFGYPFARGRLFNSIEEDLGQYDLPKNIFWASGAAVLLRRSAVNRVGLLDETFFAHMEEIDQDFRFHWAGYRVIVEPKSVVYHQSGGTLGGEHLRKMVLNHRNSLTVLLKNLTVETLCWIFPIRLTLEMLTFFSSLAKGDWKRAVAVPAGIFGVVRCFNHIVRVRKRAVPIRVVPEGQILHQLYRGSVAIEHFLFRTQTVRGLMKKLPVTNT